jgi:AraC-like DNA-binding protein
VQDCVCHCVRDSPTFENRFSTHRVALMVGGAFHYQSDYGAALLAPGSLLLGRAGGGYCYRHVDDGGDRSVVFEFADEFLEDMQRWSDIQPTARFGFGAATSIPASARTAAVTALTVQALHLDDADIWEELALGVAAIAVHAEQECRVKRPRQRSAWRDERKIASALRRMEAHHDEDCSLHLLAAEADMSVYRFLRLFKNLTAQTPRQYLITTRLKAAATRLIDTADKVLDIAYAVGFGDVSRFNQAFATAFASSPKQFRRRYGRFATK